MLELVYVSASCGLPSDAELVDLLAAARRTNGARGITGLLVYRDGAFMQVLEGPDEAVEEVFARISADERHERVAVLIRRPIEQRSFETWTMGFVPLGDVADVESVDGFDRFLLQRDALSQAELASQSHRLLLRFRELAA